MKDGSVSEMVQAFDRNVTKALDLVEGSGTWRDICPYFLRHYVNWKRKDDKSDHGASTQNVFGHKVNVTLIYQSGGGHVVKYSNNFLI